MFPYGSACRADSILASLTNSLLEQRNGFAFSFGTEVNKLKLLKVHNCRIEVQAQEFRSQAHVAHWYEHSQLLLGTGSMAGGESFP